MKFQLSVIQNPTGSFSFVGNVPTALAYVNKDNTPVDAATVTGQLMLPASYRSIKSKTWPTKFDALNAAKELGIEI